MFLNSLPFVVLLLVPSGAWSQPSLHGGAMIHPSGQRAVIREFTRSVDRYMNMRWMLEAPLGPDTLCAHPEEAQRALTELANAPAERPPDLGLAGIGAPTRPFELHIRSQEPRMQDGPLPRAEVPDDLPDDGAVTRVLVQHSHVLDRRRGARLLASRAQERTPPRDQGVHHDAVDQGSIRVEGDPPREDGQDPLLVAILDILAGGVFNCMYCGTPFRLRK